MKMYNVILVDDEPIIRKYFLSFVNWDLLGCTVVYEAGNGIAAKEYIEKHPNDVHIAIVDIRMPGMDGIELSKYICENHPGIKTIVLTAYADFSYAQSAIKYNAVDFIIKTNPDEKLQEAITKAKRLIDEQKVKEEQLNSLKSKINKNLSEIREKFFRDVINNVILNTSDMEKKVSELHIRLDNFFVVAYEIRRDTSPGDSEKQTRFIYAVKNFISLAFKDYRQSTVIMDKNLFFSVISFKDESPSKCLQAIIITSNEILSMADGYMKFDLSIGVSSMHRSIHSLSSACNEALESMESNFYSINTVSIFTPKLDSHSVSRTQQTYGTIDDIINFIQQGSTDIAIETLSRLLDDYKTNQEPIEQVKLSSIFLCSLCFRLLTNSGLNMPSVLESETDIYRQIQDCKYIRNLSDILFKVINNVGQLISMSSRSNNYLVIAVNRCLNEKFNQNINLQTIADQIHVNSNYLSKVYKKETGESVGDALNRLRMEKAKKLLRSTSDKIFKIALDVGIDDASYFTHIFTKYTGLSPKDYRLQNTGTGGKNPLY